MGIDNSIKELESKGFIIETDGNTNSYIVSFKKENASIWEEFISSHFELGYWNEYTKL